MSVVTLIGAGPGDPELMTRQAWRLLGEADVVLHDALINLPAMREAAPNASWLSVGKRAGKTSVDQAFICRALVGYARQGMRVVRLKGGDPSLFGRATEEIAACRAAGVAVQVVPGVTAACAAAAELQASLTQRGVSRSVVFVTARIGRGESAETEWLQASMAAETVVVYMGGGQAQAIAQRLIEAGKDALTPVCVVENAGGTGVRLQTTLLQLARCGLPALPGPVCLLIGAAMSEAAIVDNPLVQNEPVVVQS